MKRIFLFLIAFFYISFSSAQITDSIKVEKAIDTVKVIKSIDPTIIIEINDTLKISKKIDKFLEANIGTHLIYDDDIKYKKDTNGDGEIETFGARVQLKQYLAI